MTETEKQKLERLFFAVLRDFRAALDKSEYAQRVDAAALLDGAYKLLADEQFQLLVADEHHFPISQQNLADLRERIDEMKRSTRPPPR